MEVIKKSTPNFNDGREGKNPSKIVIHWIGAGDEDSTIAWFANPDSKVSAHYLVADDRVYQFVDENDTAWHAGNWEMNTESIGIEHEATPDHALTESSYRTSGKLVGEICKRWNIPLNRTHIIGHKEVKSTQCPGTIDIDKIILMAQTEDPLEECQKECEKLDKELDEMRASRNDWRTKYKNLEEKYEKDCSSAKEHIENLQRTVSEQNATISSMSATIQDSELEKKSLREALTSKEAELVDTKATLEGQIGRLEDNLVIVSEKLALLEKENKELKKKVKGNLDNYSKWELFVALFRR